MTSAGPKGGTERHACRPAARLFPSALRRPQSALPSLAPALVLLAVLAAGCGRGPGIIPAELRKPIDRSLVEVPAGMRFERFISNLTAPTALAFDPDTKALLVAESGAGGKEPRILRFDPADGSTFQVYPQGKVFFGLRSNPFRMYGPIGGMAVRDGVVYVSHRDERGMGVISAVTADGKGTTVVAGLPAQGDYGVTDVQFSPEGRLYFGVGAATNSGVVGLDNWQRGWPQRHRKLADRPHADLRLRGPRFFTSNPGAGLFSGSELAITAPFQPFGEYYRGTIDAAPDGKPNAAIYSIDPRGGVGRQLNVEAHGMRLPSGLAFSPAAGRLYASNRGMEMRGTRPVRDDPDAVVLVPAAGNAARWYGWPDYSADLRPITELPKPPEDLLRRSGNSELNFVTEHGGAYSPPDQFDRDSYVRAVLPPLSGVAKMTFVPDEGPLSEFRRQLIVALSGDRAPFATSGKRLKGPVGYEVVIVDVDSDARTARDFIRNTAGVPRHLADANNADLLERPIDVKVGPDGYLYVLDLGRIDPRRGRDRPTGRTGQVFRLLPANAPATTAPADASAPAGAAAETAAGR